MKSYIKTRLEHIEALGEAFELRELTAKAYSEIRALPADDMGAGLAKAGVVAWADESLEAIKEAVGPVALGEIGAAIFKLSGIDLDGQSEKKA